MRIGIDIDDTLANTRDLQQIYWQEFIKENPTDEFSSDLPSNINSFGNDYIDKFWDTYRYDFAFKTVGIKGASEVIDKLKDKHEIWIMTSRPKHKYKNNLEELLKKWLNDNKLYCDEIRTTIYDKGLYMKENNVDLLVDDSYHHCESAIKNGKKAIWFSELVREDICCFQTHDWNTVLDIITNLED